MSDSSDSDTKPPVAKRVKVEEDPVINGNGVGTVGVVKREEDFDNDETTSIARPVRIKKEDMSLSRM